LIALAKSLKATGMAGMAEKNTEYSIEYKDKHIQRVIERDK